ncbi:hypothetical protein [Paraburkholderia sp. BL10I2N1]|uniref:hypothetical protein n=1 Tax=Paraburkholderia sp. BL10I2N1 TaxID=1938796 RepID=UPI00141501A8|nr:hypothetical protein [Paraburkholderia sp. BL10I2N1]
MQKQVAPENAESEYRAPNSYRPVPIDRMVQFSIGLFLSAVAAGASHLEGILKQFPESNKSVKA